MSQLSPLLYNGDWKGAVFDSVLCPLTIRRWNYHNKNILKLLFYFRKFAVAPTSSFVTGICYHVRTVSQQLGRHGQQCPVLLSIPHKAAVLCASLLSPLTMEALFFFRVTQTWISRMWTSRLPYTLLLSGSTPRLWG